MKAVRIHRYGGPEVLQLDQVDTPSPRPRDVLVRVKAASVNPVDWKLRSGAQRSIVPYRLPWILGLDASGVVEAVGAQVKRWKVGDEVWSSPTFRRPGTYAQYVCIDERQVARKPANLSHEEAASMPLVGLTAYQCLVVSGRLKPQERVLIHAGAGGVGSFAIQLARHLGAHVITTASARNEELLRSLGAHEVIDYQKTNFADACAPVDLVLDSIGEAAFADNVRVLRPGGRLVNITLDVGGQVDRYGVMLSLPVMAWGLVKLSLWPLLRKGIRSWHVIKRSDGEQLGAITTLVEAGAIRPVIDRIFPLAEVQAAHLHSQSSHARGKIVLRI